MDESLDHGADEVGDFGVSSDAGSSTEKPSDPKDRAAAIQEPAIPATARVPARAKTEFEAPMDYLGGKR